MPTLGKWVKGKLQFRMEEGELLRKDIVVALLEDDF